MGVMSVVHWWEESQMRVLVLGSLVVQLLLLIFTFLRRRAIPGWIRFLMWLAYLGGDAIAIYALATLFNRHKDQDRGSGKSKMEVMWAPILLLHLGGHDGITAYNIEDNELWSRHLLTAVSQVTVAIYVFCKSWTRGSDKRLLLASILLFVPGVLKCFAKPWALKRASINSLVSSPAAKRTAKKGKGGEMDPNSLEKYVKQAKAFVAFVQEPKNKGNEAQSERACVENNDRPPPQQGKQDKDKVDPFEEYVSDFVVGQQKDEGGAQGERAPPVEDTKRTGSKKQGEREWILRGEANKLFVDLSSQYAGRRLSVFKYFWVLISQKKGETLAYGYVRRGLASAFLLLYTKLKTAGIVKESDFQVDESLALATLFGLCHQWIRLSRMVLPWAAIGLFHQSHREAYNGTDAKITYAILCCTAVLELFSTSPMEDSVISNNAVRTLRCQCHYQIQDSDELASKHFVSRVEWPEIVAQYSLMRYFARNKNHGKLMWIVSKFGCKDMVDQRWCMEPCFSSRVITELVLQYLKAGWEKKIQDVASYRSFTDNRGHWALEGNEHLSWSIKAPFDVSVLLWHVATDLCFFSSSSSEHTCALASETEGDAPAQETKCAACSAVQCRQMSNYMVYLLFVNPEMLLPGTRRNLFTEANDDLNLKLKDNLVGDDKQNPQSFCHCQQVEEKDVMKKLIETMQGESRKQGNGSKEVSKQEGQPNEENFIDDAWDLAQGLLKLRDDFGDKRMWEVIQGVWMEMLCFSASRCRGYLHAKALGSGGEFLSYVWLLMFYMGMETFTERLQREREDLSRWEANNNTAPAPRASDAHNGNAMTSPTCRIRNHGAPSPSHFHTGSSTSSSEILIVDIV